MQFYYNFICIKIRTYHAMQLKLFLRDTSYLLHHCLLYMNAVDVIASNELCLHVNICLESFNNDTSMRCEKKKVPPLTSLHY